MAVRIDSLLIDCADTRALAEFWAAALGWTIDATTDDEVAVVDPKDPKHVLLFVQVPETKTIKNRLHLDLRPSNTRDEEVERLKGLGATVLEGFGGPEAT